MTVVITGGAGFIGYHLARLHAQRGDRVIVLDNLAKLDGRQDEALDALSRQPGVSIHPCNLTEPVPLGELVPPSVDVVYHLAAINGTQLFYDRPYDVARTNVMVTVQLLDAIQRSAIRVGRLLYSSTSEVYAGADAIGVLRLPTDERVPVVFPQPTPTRFSYGTSKFMGEVLCEQFGRTHQVPWTVVRYHNIYGPRMGSRHVIPEFIARVHAREHPFSIYGGEETRAFCYVDDAVEATRAAAASPSCAGEIVHIGNSREELTMRELARRVMRAMGEELEIVERGRRQDSVARRCPDTSKLTRLTGCEAQVDLDQGLAKTLEWYMARTGAR
ncbi:MAG: NAD-dependent epimerase/dehydratase family protein [Candidatus Omnitrophica bacterium]|nr:NAD-dependent epimerase/dehydratase family protein [Candidatus Omnitrophota bacterium]